MKVNRSKLFKNAWKCIKKWNVSLSKALKMAWAMAKKELEYRKYYGIRKKRKIRRDYNKIGFNFRDFIWITIVRSKLQ